MKGRSKAVRVVYPAIFGALALVLLYLGTMVPTGTWGIAAVAGIMPVFAVLSSGLASGFLCWAGVTLLAFLLLPDKFLALLFGALFGLYPVLKGVIERLRKLPMEYPLKLAFFNASLTVIFLTMKASVLASLPTALSVVWILYLVGNVVFLVYDFGLSRLISFFMARLGRRPGKTGGRRESN